MTNPARRTTTNRISVALATDAVIASYIHEISTRHHARDETPADHHGDVIPSRRGHSLKARASVVESLLAVAG